MDYNKLFTLYSHIKDRLEKQNISFITIGGHASILHKFSEFTKDLDIGIESKADSEVLSLFESLLSEGIKVSYRFGLGAPLDARWGNGGWTSHFEIYSNDLRGRLDVFTSLPRVDSSLIFKAGLSDLNILAETKKTQRDKDWDTVKSIAVRMLESDDLKGFLHLFDSDILKDLNRDGLAIPKEILNLRPALGLIQDSPDLLEAALSMEKMFWQKWDKIRLNTYLEASVPYYKAVKNDLKNLSQASLIQQHQDMISLAVDLLPINPFLNTPVEKIVEEIKENIFKIYSKELEPYLPNTNLIVKKYGICNPLIEI